MFWRRKTWPDGRAEQMRMHLRSPRVATHDLRCPRMPESPQAAPFFDDLRFLLNSLSKSKALWGASVTTSGGRSAEAASQTQTSLPRSPDRCPSANPRTTSGKSGISGILSRRSWWSWFPRTSPHLSFWICDLATRSCTSQNSGSSRIPHLSSRKAIRLSSARTQNCVLTEGEQKRINGSPRSPHSPFTMVHCPTISFPEVRRWLAAEHSDKLNDGWTIFHLIMLRVERAQCLPCSKLWHEGSPSLVTAVCVRCTLCQLASKVRIDMVLSLVTHLLSYRFCHQALAARKITDGTQVLAAETSSTQIKT